jgi:hypothetical protein
MGLLYGATTFAVVAGWAGSGQVFPGMLTPQAPRDNMVDGQVGCSVSTVLACVIISAQYFPFG